MAGIVVVDVGDDHTDVVQKLLTEHSADSAGHADPDGQRWGMAGKIAASLS